MARGSRSAGPCAQRAALEPAAHLSMLGSEARRDLCSGRAGGCCLTNVSDASHATRRHNDSGNLLRSQLVPPAPRGASRVASGLGPRSGGAPATSEPQARSRLQRSSISELCGRSSYALRRSRPGNRRFPSSFLVGRRRSAASGPLAAPPFEEPAAAYVTAARRRSMSNQRRGFDPEACCGSVGEPGGTSCISACTQSPRWVADAG